MSKSADAFRTISEVADWLGVPAHVLRFWESKFTQVKPVKRAGGRRYYRPADMQLLGGIRKLLHDDGMTIKGVQKLIREQGISAVAALSAPLDPDQEADTADADADAAGIALDVPEQDSEPRGQIVRFQRRPDDRVAPAPVNNAESGLAAHAPSDGAPIAPDSMASASIPAVDTPDDPPDGAAALPSALSLLALSEGRASIAASPRSADIARRLAQLRADMASRAKST